MSTFMNNAKLIHGIELEYSFPSGNNKTWQDVKTKLEQEGINYTHNERDGTPVTREGLPPVYECVLPPMARGLVQVNELNKICTIIENLGAFIHNKCGGHVHFGLKAIDTSVTDSDTWTKNSLAYTGSERLANRPRRFYSEDLKPLIMPLELGKAIAKRYALNQLIINTMLPKSRTNNHWCKPIGRQVGTSNFASAISGEAINNIMGGKYHAVNFSNWKPTGGTLEFRQAKGSLSVDKINRWIDILENLITTTDLHFMDYSQSTIREETTPRQPFGRGTRLAQIWEMCRSDNGATVEEMMMATGTSSQNIRGRISEMRSRFGQSSIVTNTQQANNHQYRDGNQFSSYKILEIFSIGSDGHVIQKPSNRSGNPSIWSDVDDDDFEWWQGRIASL